MSFECLLCHETMSITDKGKKTLIWQKHMGKKHGNLSLSERNRYRVDDIPAQVECLGCNGVFSDYGPSLINHISRCGLSNLVLDASRTVGEVFPESKSLKTTTKEMLVSSYQKRTTQSVTPGTRVVVNKESEESDSSNSSVSSGDPFNASIRRPSYLRASNGNSQSSIGTLLPSTGSSRSHLRSSNGNSQSSKGTLVPSIGSSQSDIGTLVPSQSSSSSDSSVRMPGSFLPSESFMGHRPGYVFKRSDLGLGYHLDRVGPLAVGRNIANLRDDASSDNLESSPLVHDALEGSHDGASVNLESDSASIQATMERSPNGLRRSARLMSVLRSQSSQSSGNITSPESSRRGPMLRSWSNGTTPHETKSPESPEDISDSSEYCPSSPDYQDAMEEPDPVDPPHPVVNRHVPAIRDPTLPLSWHPDSDNFDNTRTLIADMLGSLSSGLYDMHYSYKSSFTDCFCNLLSKITSDPVNSKADRYPLVAALLILPGVVNRMQKLKQKGIIGILQSFVAAENISTCILDYAFRLIRDFPIKMNGSKRKLSASRVDSLTRAGRLGALLREIESDSTNTGPICRTQLETEDLVRRFHPEASEEDDIKTLISNMCDDGGSLNSPQVDTEELLFAISRLPEVSASGSSGWSFRLIKFLFGADIAKLKQNHNKDSRVRLPYSAMADDLALFFNMFGSELLHPESEDLINTSRLLFIPKKNGDVRPIAIGDSLFRLYYRILNAKLAPAVGKLLAPLQLCVGISGGCEILASIAHDYLKNDDRCVMTLDLPNAFNSISRNSILVGLQHYAPELIRTFLIGYQRPNALRSCTTESSSALVGYSRTGCRQGDPLSMLYFAVSIHSALVSIHKFAMESDPSEGRQCFVSAYADDIAIMGDREHVISIFPQICNIIDEIVRVHPNARKCKLICRSFPIDWEPDEFLDGMEICSGGAKFLGIGIGSDSFVSECVEEELKSQSSSIDVLKHKLLPLQTAFAIIKYCINARPGYLSRNTETRLIKDSLIAFDNRVNESISIFTGSELIPTTEVLRHLPSHLSGLGIPMVSGPAAILALQKRLILVQQFINDHGLQFIKLPLCPKLNMDLDTFNSNEFSRLIELLPQNCNQLKYLVSGEIDEDEQTLSGLWLSWRGGSDRRFHMDDATFRMAIRMRLILDASNSVIFCPYAGTNGRHTAAVNLNDDFGHCLRCRPAIGVDKYIQTRHNLLRDALVKMIGNCLYGTQGVPQRALRSEIDVRTCIPNISPGPDLIADAVSIFDIEEVNAHTYVIDVTVADPTSAAGRTHRGKAAESAERSKRLKYRPILDSPNVTFVPFALECNGLIGGEALAFLASLRQRTMDPQAIPSFLYLASSIMAKFTAKACMAGWENANAVNAPSRRHVANRR